MNYFVKVMKLCFVTKMFVVLVLSYSYHGYLWSWPCCRLLNAPLLEPVRGSSSEGSGGPLFLPVAEALRQWDPFLCSRHLHGLLDSEIN